MNTNIKYTTYVFTYLNHMFRLRQRSHNQIAQNREKDFFYINM